MQDSRRDSHHFYLCPAAPLWVRRDGDYGDLVFFGTIVPEYSVCCRRGLLGIGLEDFFTFRPFEARKFMGPQTGMPGIVRKGLKSFLYGLVPFGKPFIDLEAV
jgi:hypothetical protein